MRFRLGMAAFYDKHVRTSGLLLIQIRLVLRAQTVVMSPLLQLMTHYAT